ncbi:PLP-dependent transferase [Backusella circina FSU 941]|nr:PLP-dependent transferase [Backusella circina FSU 941]
MRMGSLMPFKHRILLNNNALRLHQMRSIATLPKPVHEITHPDNQVSTSDLDTIEQYEKYLIVNDKRPNILFDHGVGCHLYDNADRDYLDFTAGISVSALGHADTNLIQEMYGQANKLIHTSRLFHDTNTGRLAELLIKKTRVTAASSDANWAKKALLTDSGREALALAFKIVRAWGTQTDPKKTKVVCFKSSNKRQIINDTEYIPFNHMREMYHSIDENTCAVIVEPIQGESGIHVATGDFLEGLRERCNENNALLIYDESECGVGRTGKLWAHQHYDKTCSPDGLIMAKSMANGVPIGAILANNKMVDIISNGHYNDGGNPLTAAIALSVMERISNPEFLYHVNEVGQSLRRDLKALEEKFPEIIKQVRGKGLLLGVEFKRNPSSIIKHARQRGLLLTNMTSNTIGFTPPLTLTKAEAREGIARFSGALEQFHKNAKDESLF